jgi:hypothetical protein
VSSVTTTPRAAEALRRKVERQRELRRVQLVPEPEAFDAEPASARKVLQVSLPVGDAPLREHGLGDVERAVGRDEAHPSHFALARR